MHLHNQINPTKEQFKALFNLPKDQAIVMVNMLKYNGENGKASYAKYMKNVGPFLKAAKGKVIWKGASLHTVIGDSEDQPDVFMMVEYPSVEHFIGMITNPEYQEVAKDRTLGLTYGGLVAAGIDYKKW